MNRRVAIVVACTLLACLAASLVVPVGTEVTTVLLASAFPSAPPHGEHPTPRVKPAAWTDYRLEPVWQRTLGANDPPFVFYELGTATYSRRVVIWPLLALEWLAILAIGAVFAWRVRTRRTVAPAA